MLVNDSKSIDNLSRNKSSCSRYRSSHFVSIRVACKVLIVDRALARYCLQPLLTHVYRGETKRNDMLFVIYKLATSV